MLDVVPVLLNSMKGGGLVPHNDRGALSRGHTAVVKVIFENFATAQLAALANMRQAHAPDIALLCMHLGSHKVLQSILAPLTGALDIYSMNDTALIAACSFDPASTFSRWVNTRKPSRIRDADEAMVEWGSLVGLHWPKDTKITPLQTIFKVDSPENKRWMRLHERAQKKRGKRLGADTWEGHTGADDAGCTCVGCLLGLCDEHDDGCTCGVCGEHDVDCECGGDHCAARARGERLGADMWDGHTGADDDNCKCGGCLAGRCDAHDVGCTCGACAVGGGRGKPSISKNNVRKKAARAAAPRTRRNMKAHQNTCRVRLSLSTNTRRHSSQFLMTS